MNMNDFVFIGTSIFLYEDLIESFLLLIKYKLCM